MREELDRRLCDEYPSIFRDRRKSPQETAMCWGFPGDGWFAVINELCAKLHLLESVDVFPIAVQVKEKIGTLRFYCRLEYDQRWNEQQQLLWRGIVSDCCRSAEFQSGSTCEECGKPGSRREGTATGVQTLCDDCEKIQTKPGNGGIKE